MLSRCPHYPSIHIIYPVHLSRCPHRQYPGIHAILIQCYLDVHTIPASTLYTRSIYLAAHTVSIPTSMLWLSRYSAISMSTLSQHPHYLPGPSISLPTQTVSRHPCYLDTVLSRCPHYPSIHIIYPVHLSRCPHRQYPGIHAILIQCYLDVHTPSIHIIYPVHLSRCPHRQYPDIHAILIQCYLAAHTDSIPTSTLSRYSAISMSTLSQHPHFLPAPCSLLLSPCPRYPNNPYYLRLPQRQCYLSIDCLRIYWHYSFMVHSRDSSHNRSSSNKYVPNW